MSQNYAKIHVFDHREIWGLLEETKRQKEHGSTIKTYKNYWHEKPQRCPSTHIKSRNKNEVKAFLIQKDLILCNAESVVALSTMQTNVQICSARIKV